MNILKRTIAGVIGFAMTLTAVNLSIVTTNVYAAQGAQLPSVTKFATPADLADADKFTLHTDNGSGVAQKVNFGKNPTSKNVQTWYIVGADSDGSLVLMCNPANSLGSSMFDEVNITYKSSAIEDYLNSQGEALNYFTDAEEALMNSPTVYTNKYGSEDIDDTSDKLYLAYGDYDADSYITVGANSKRSLNNGIKIGLKTDNSPTGSPYAAESNGQFWLRAPYAEGDTRALIATLGNYVGSKEVYSRYAVVPAFNLDLSRVLFASGATAASSEPNLNDSAMTFRIKNDGQFTSTAKVARQTISVTYADGDSDVYLYVQGKNGDSDWVKTVQLNGTKDYTLSEIGAPDGADLTKCKVWLEKYDSGSNLTYAEYASVASKYSVTVSSNDDRMGSAVAKVNGLAVSEAFAGETVTLEAAAVDGYAFDKWEVVSGGVTITDNKFLMPASEIVLTAHFKKNSSIEPVDPTKRFKDVLPGKWYSKLDGPIAYVVTNGIMSGTGDGTTFEPEAPCTREVFVQILYNAEGKPGAGPLNPFSDVKANKWYYDAITWARANNVTSGKSATLFGVGENVTREQLAQFLMNYATKRGFNTNDRADVSKFPDAGEISGWAKDAISWANANGIINGKANKGVSYLDPKGNATRAETAQMIMAFWKKFVK